MTEAECTYGTMRALFRGPEGDRPLSAIATPLLESWLARSERMLSTPETPQIQEAVRTELIRRKQVLMDEVTTRWKVAQAAMFSADQRATCATPTPASPIVGLDAMLPPLAPASKLGDVAGLLTQAAEAAYGAGEYRLAYDIGVMARRAEKTAKTKEPSRD